MSLFLCWTRAWFWFDHHQKAEVFSFKMIPYLCQLLVSQPANSIINVGKSTFELVIHVISSDILFTGGLTGQHSKCWILAYLVWDLTIFKVSYLRSKVTNCNGWDVIGKVKHMGFPMLLNLIDRIQHIFQKNPTKKFCNFLWGVYICYTRMIRKILNFNKMAVLNQPGSL